MKEPQGTTPKSEHPEPMPNEDGSGSLPNNNGEQNRDRAKTSAFDELLQWDKGFFRKESRLLARFAARFAARLNVPLSEVEDMIQQAWMIVIGYRYQFPTAKIKRQVHGSMKTVVRREVVDVRRHLSCCPRQSLAEQEIEPSDDAEARRADMAELREELAARLVKASRGNEENLALLRARYLQGLSIAELAQQFGLTEKAVERRLGRLRKNMRELPE